MSAQRRRSAAKAPIGSYRGEILYDSQRAAQRRIIEVPVRHYGRVPVDHRPRGDAEGQESTGHHGCAITDRERAGDDAVRSDPDVASDDRPAFSAVGDRIAESAAGVDQGT